MRQKSAATLNEAMPETKRIPKLQRLNRAVRVARVSLLLLLLCIGCFLLFNSHFSTYPMLIFINSQEKSVELLPLWSWFSPQQKLSSSNKNLKDIRFLKIQSAHQQDQKNIFVNKTQIPLLAQCSSIPDEQKFDCHPEQDASQEKCEARGCCWRASIKHRQFSVNNSKTASIDVPFCYYPNEYPTYIITSKMNTLAGFNLTMTRHAASYYPNDVRTLEMIVSYEVRYRLHIEIVDPSNKRYRVPLPVSRPTVKVADQDYIIQTAGVGQPFSFSVTRVSDGTVLLNTTGAFIYADQFLQLSTFLPSFYIYGLGEHRDSLLHSMNWTRYVLWARDHSPHENVNLYGVHPFYQMMENNGSSHGVFLLNSNAMEVVLQPAPALTWRTIGGIFDLYVFTGPGPDQVIQQYTEVIGHSHLPPYWGLGYHLSKYGYNTVNETLKVAKRNQAARIPQDGQWNDIDYMDHFLDFTTGIKKFGDQSALAGEIHSMGIHYCILIDCGISSSVTPGTYPAYDLGKEMGIFINDTYGKPIVGKVWPGETVWPDFTNPRTQDYWTEMLARFHDSVAYDGILIDMNEVSSFVDGSIAGCPTNSSLENPPFVPAVADGALQAKTLCTTARQHWSINYNVHSLYGYTQSIATYEGMKLIRGARPLIISRSTFSGHGKYGGHWTGDNQSTFYDMLKSISAILSMNMFGVSLTGSNICGFAGDTTEELCLRWHQLGAFYPYAINHNTPSSRDQDPAAFSPSFINATRDVLNTRYLLLPFLYTLFYSSHTSGSTVVRPLFYEYPKDTNTYGIDTQFLWGSCLLISPILTQGALNVTAYFPHDIWYDLYTGEKLESSGQEVILMDATNRTNLHLRSGSVIPVQGPALTTTESRDNLFGWLISLNNSAEAIGYHYWDDGETIDVIEHGYYYYSAIVATPYQIYNIITRDTYMAPMTLGSVTVYGFKFPPQQVWINRKAVVFRYDIGLQVLEVRDIRADMHRSVVMTWK